MKFNIKKNIPAFSIIEIMAVVFIIAIGMVGMMNLIGQSIRVQRLNEHTLIAYQLAQEGIELVRVIRDDNWLAEDSDVFLNVMEPGDYCLDYLDTVLNPFLGSCNLYLDSNNNFYVREDSNNTQTPYSRLISIEQYDDKEYAVNVKVKISWDDVSGTFEYEAETRLYDWY